MAAGWMSQYEEDDMLESYFYGYGPPPSPKYSVVEIADLATYHADLSVGEKSVTSYQELVDNYNNSNNRSYHYNYPAQRSTNFDIPARKPDYLPVKNVRILASNKLMNFRDGDIVNSVDPFQLYMVGTSHINDFGDWEYFGSTGLDVYTCGKKKCQSRADNRLVRSLQYFRVGLKPHCSFGHLQLIQTSKRGWNSSLVGSHPYGSIINLYVMPSSARKTYPPVIVVRPNCRLTYVPIESDQTLQLVLPSFSNISYWTHIKSLSIKQTGRIQAFGGELTCHSFAGQGDGLNSFPIFFEIDELSTPGMAIIPHVETINGKKYAIIHSSIDRFEIYMDGINGIIIRKLEDFFDPFRGLGINCLDQQKRLLIESMLSFSNTEGQKVYDMRLSLMDKNVRRLQIHYNSDSHVFTTTAS